MDNIEKIKNDFVSIYIPKGDYHSNLINTDNQVMDFLCKNVDWNKSIIDAGACLGFYSKFFCQFSKAKVYAFEPDLNNYEYLIFNNSDFLKKNKLKIFSYCLADKKYKTKLFAEGKNNRGQKLFLKQTYVDLLKKQLKELKNKWINVTTIDHEIPSNESISLIKIDTEGFDYEVLLGANGIIKMYKPDILIGVHEYPNLDGSFTTNEKDIFDFMSKNKYKLLKEFTHDEFYFRFCG